MRELRGKVAVITGAANGIGAAIARRLASEGAQLCLVDLRADALDSVLRDFGPEHEIDTHVLDVADATAWEALAGEVAARRGGADLLVNNAGFTIHGAFADHSIADLDRIVDVNLRGVLYGCRAFLPQLRGRPEAHIVNVSSLAGRVAFPYQSSYCATKYGVRGLSASLRMELAADGIGVTAVMPGAVATSFLDRATSYDRAAASALTKLMLAHGVDPTRVADRVLRAVRCDEAEVLIGWDARVTTAVAALSPKLLYGWLARAFRKRTQIQ
jgi:short-subunit dehydrogenase